ncbi:MAG: hypothetical protein WB987_00835 [Candidatus Acidiferrales bacterium]
MEALLDFAAVSGAIVLSLGIALSLEWFALNGLLKFMPPRQPVAAAADANAAEMSETELAADPASVAVAFIDRKRAA